MEFHTLHENAMYLRDFVLVKDAYTVNTIFHTAFTPKRYIPMAIISNRLLIDDRYGWIEDEIKGL